LACKRRRLRVTGRHRSASLAALNRRSDRDWDMSDRFSAFAAVAVAVAVAVASVVLAATASAGAAGHAKLTPPVIKESFTPLPCNGARGHQSTLQMEGCAEH